LREVDPNPGVLGSYGQGESWSAEDGRLSSHEALQLLCRLVEGEDFVRYDSESVVIATWKTGWESHARKRRKLLITTC
jgi:hypothetical protein